MSSPDVTPLPGTFAAAASASVALAYWHHTDRGWTTVCLSAVLLVAVELGVQIPW